MCNNCWIIGCEMYKQKLKAKCRITPNIVGGILNSGNKSSNTKITHRILLKLNFITLDKNRWSSKSTNGFAAANAGNFSSGCNVIAITPAVDGPPNYKSLRHFGYAKFSNPDLTSSKDLVLPGICKTKTILFSTATSFVSQPVYIIPEAIIQQFHGLYFRRLSPSGSCCVIIRKEREQSVGRNFS